MATDIEGSHLAPDLFCLTVTGEIDMANADELDEAIDEALHVDGVTRVFVEMERTTFLDSAGIRTLLFSHHNAAKRGITFCVVKPSPIVRRVLQLTGVIPGLGSDRR